MSVAQILEQLAANAGRTQRARGALIGNTIADVSQVPAAIINDRERQRQLRLQESRQAEQLGFQRNADARAGKDQALQDAAAQRALEHEAVVSAGLAAAIGPNGDPSNFDGRAAFEAVSKMGKPEAITDVIKRHRELAAKPLILKPGDVGFNPDTNTPIPGLSAPEKKPDYTIGGQRFGGDGTPIGPLVPRQTAPAAGTIHDTPAGLVRIGPDNTVTPVVGPDGKPLKGYHPPPATGGLNGLYGDIDPKAIAAQIRKAEHPPDISQYGRPAAAAIASELARKGPNGEAPFNLSAAQREWKAQLRLNSTMNGAQQVRLDESIRSGLAMYDKVDELAQQWDSKGWGPLSRVNLAAARDGLKGAKAASIANQLTGQIGQLTSDIATIEQGGLTPTNEARAVAEKSMQDWWGKGTILDMTAQGRYNMQIRHTARNTQEPMTPGNGTDNRPAAPATPPATGTIRARDAQGVLHEAPAGTPLPAGWKLER